jgi:hypothetical protein
VSWPARLGLCALALLVGCKRSSAGPREAGKRAAAELTVAERIFDAESGLHEGWEDYGWSARKYDKGAPASLDLSNYGGWLVHKAGLKSAYGGLLMRFRAPKEYGDFFEIRVDSTRADIFPRVRVGPQHRRDLPEGWSEVFIPFSQLDPQRAKFDQVVVHAWRSIGPEKVLIDALALTGDGDDAAQAPASKGPAKPVRMTIDCLAKSHPISPLVYGIGYSPMHDANDVWLWDLGPPTRRWGGNPTSRFFWELGRAWNTAFDWFFMIVNYSGLPAFTYDNFLEDDLLRGAKTALTVPMVGWVAKDTTSFAFPVSVFGAQAAVAPENPAAGNGVDKGGKPISPGSPGLTSVAAGPDFVRRWVEAIRKKDEKRGRSVHQYILDNEPALWNSTHRDVHPEPVTYDELLGKTIAYASAVRQADPEALIAGPAEWGWPGYLFSASDAQAGFFLKPDRRAHGNKPLVPWYLEQLAEHRKKTGQKLLDVLDLHYYPQAKNVGVATNGGTDAATAALRLRSTRSLWDPGYIDESWINDTIRLIPRMKEWIAEEYPGLGISIGEWNFGAEEHMSGGLAVAEVLGRFGQQGVTSAYYWTYPPRSSPAYWGFRAYRNYDGKGAAFPGEAIEAKSSLDSASVFVARDSNRLVAVILNLDPDAAIEATIDAATCGKLSGRRVFQYRGGPDGFVDVTPKEPVESFLLKQAAPAYSITVLELRN